MGVWKMLVNKETLNEYEEKKLRDFAIHSDYPCDDTRDQASYQSHDKDRSPYRPPPDDHHAHLPPFGRYHGPNDRGCGSHPPVAGDKRNMESASPYDRGHGRSPRTTRHSGDKRRVRRRTLSYESDVSDGYSEASDRFILRS